MVVPLREEREPRSTPQGGYESAQPPSQPSAQPPPASSRRRPRAAASGAIEQHHGAVDQLQPAAEVGPGDDHRVDEPLGGQVEYDCTCCATLHKIVWEVGAGFMQALPWGCGSR